MMITVATRQFTFMAASVSVDDNKVGATAIYTIYLNRMYNDQLQETAWQSTPLAANSISTVVFPAQYTNSLLSSATCINVMVSSILVAGASCSVINLTLVVENAFATIS